MPVYPDKVFRKYDIRGISGEEITEEFAYALGLAYAKYTGNEGKVAVGGDVRKTTPALKKALIEGLTDGGLDVVDIGTVPTPLMYYATFNLPVSGGIQVTASHNPREYNGFKIAVGRETIYGEQIQELKRLMNRGVHRAPSKGRVESHDITSEYIDFVLSNIKISRKFNLVVDTGNGVAGPLIERLFPPLGISFKGLFLEPDGDFPNHLPDPTVVEYMKWAMEEVRKGNYDGAFGYDGDADRIGVVDENGNLIFGDKIVAIIARQVLRNHPGATIILDVKCSRGVIEYIENLGGKVLLWKTGHSLMKAKLKETGAPLAGEMSGHIFIKDRFFGYDDAIYASLRFLEEVAYSGKSISELLSEIPNYYSTPEIRVEVDPEERKFEIVDDLVRYFKEKGYNVIDIDGVRLEFDDGFALARASNTQPVIVLRFEGKTPERMEELRNMFFEVLGRYPEVKLP